MGANAQTAVPAFTAGQVLTAAQQTQINTGIPVFADTTARDAAFGGTGEKTLAEGQFAYIEATNTTQYYDGATWQTLGGGLTWILSQTVGSAVSSVTVSNAFSSTYDNYLVLYQGGSSSATNDIRVTFGATATGYYSSGYYMNFSASTMNGQFINNGAYISAGRGTTAGNNLRMDVFGPNLADETIVMINSVGPVTSDVSQINQGFVNNTTQYTAFTLTPSTGTLTGGVIRVYGYQNS